MINNNFNSSDSKKTDSIGFYLTENYKNWTFLVGKEEFTSTFDQVIKFMILEFKFDIKEIEKAVDYMLKWDHNTAHFGINQTFMYSMNKNKDN